jgi:hypothetical protein
VTISSRQQARQRADHGHHVVEALNRSEKARHHSPLVVRLRVRAFAPPLSLRSRRPHTLFLRVHVSAQPLFLVPCRHPAGKSTWPWIDVVPSSLHSLGGVLSLGSWIKAASWWVRTKWHLARTPIACTAQPYCATRWDGRMAYRTGQRALIGSASAPGWSELLGLASGRAERGTRFCCDQATHSALFWPRLHLC